MEVAGPLGTPLGLAQRKRASPRVNQITSPGLMHETRCSGLVHWDDPEAEKISLPLVVAYIQVRVHTATAEQDTVYSPTIWKNNFCMTSSDSQNNQSSCMKWAEEEVLVPL